MVSTRPLISKSYSLCTNPFVTILSAPITISNTITFMFQIFSTLEQVRGICFPFRFLSVLPWSQSERQSTLFGRFCFFVFCFLLTITKSGRLAEIRWFVCISKSQIILCISFSWTDSGLCIYHLFLWSNFNFLHNSQLITLLTKSGLVLYSICANLRHSLIMWLILSSLSPHNLHLLFCCVLSILIFTWSLWRFFFCFVFLCCYQKRFNFSRFSFLCHVQIYSFEISLFVTWTFHKVVFLPIFVFWLFLFCWFLCCCL